MTRLISYVKSQVELDRQGSRDLFTVHGTGGLKGAIGGEGILYSWVERADETAALSCQFALKYTAPAVYDNGEGDVVRVAMEASAKFPCKGIITRTLEGFIIAPAVKLEPIRGPSIVLMILSPSDASHGISVVKNVLTVPNEESMVAVTTGGGELNCLGTISGHSKVARIILNRNPYLPVYKSGFNETLSTLRGGGQISAVWKPVARTFEELVLAFYPSELGSFVTRSVVFTPTTNFSFDRIATNLNAFENDDLTKATDYVIGDGNGVHYTLRLVLDRGLGRHTTDETKLTVT